MSDERETVLGFLWEEVHPIMAITWALIYVFVCGDETATLLQIACIMFAYGHAFRWTWNAIDERKA